MDFTKVKDALARMGFAVSEFATAEEAAAYLAGVIEHKTVGIGGSETAHEMNLLQVLEAAGNEVYCHHEPPAGMDVTTARRLANAAQVYIASVNGMAETGEMVNIDNTGNRVAAISFGNERVYLIVGKNKLVPTLEEALHRARHVASPLNARRMHRSTPCAAGANQCYDCDSVDRICRNISILLRKPNNPCYYEVVLVHEDLGY